MDVQVGRIGAVAFGPDEGRFVAVVPDGYLGSSGFHIFTWRAKPDGTGFASLGGRRLDALIDHADSLAEVEARFEKLGWSIAWQETTTELRD